MSANPDGDQTPPWQSKIWLGLGVALVALITLMLALVGWTQWRVLDVIGNAGGDPAFVAVSLGLSNVVLLRFLAVLVGGAICFSGLAVSFFAHERATVFATDSAQGSQQGAAPIPISALPRLRLASHSPGIIAIFVGAAVIVSALFATTRSDYKGPTTLNVVTDGASAQSGSKAVATDGDLHGAAHPDQLIGK